MIAEWSVNEWLGIFGAISVVLSGVCGAVWWMSALYSNVRAIRSYMAGWRNEDRREKEIIWNKLNSHSKLVNNHAMSLQNHSSRIETLEKNQS